MSHLPHVLCRLRSEERDRDFGVTKNRPVTMAGLFCFKQGLRKYPDRVYLPHHPITTLTMPKEQRQSAGKKPQGTKKPARKRNATAGLTKRQATFVDQMVLNGGNASQAIRAAGYKGVAPHVVASQTLANINIASIVARRRAEMAEMANVRATEVLGVLNSHLYASPEFVLEPDGTFDYEKCVARGVAHLIREMEFEDVSTVDADGNLTTARRVKSVKLHDAQAAARQLCKVLGLEVEKKKNPREIAETAVADLIARAARQGITLTQEEAIAALAPHIPQIALRIQEPT